MWIPAALVYLFAGLGMFAGWPRESEKRISRLQADFQGQSTQHPGMGK